MDMLKLTGRVRIIRMPSGEAPEGVRKAWIGIEFPCFPTAGPVGLVTGVVTGNIRKEKRGVIFVPQIVALEALKKKNADAAAWWSDHGFPQTKDARFVFGLDEIEILAGVTPAPITHVTDEMMGDPNR